MVEAEWFEMPLGVVQVPDSSETHARVNILPLAEVHVSDVNVEMPSLTGLQLTQMQADLFDQVSPQGSEHLSSPTKVGHTCCVNSRRQ